MVINRFRWRSSISHLYVMFKKIKESLYRTFLGDKLFDFGTVIRDERKKNSYTEISMSINSSKGERFVNLGLKQKNGGRTNFSWSRIQNVEGIRELKETCERIEILFTSDLSDEDIKALENNYPLDPKT